VWQFKFACCLQVAEIRCVVHQLSCFGVELLLDLITRGYFLCLATFLLGKVRDLSASPRLSAGCDGSLFVFQFFRVILFWILLTGSGDGHCGMQPGLPQAEACHPLALWPPIISLLLPPSLVGFQNSQPLCCVLVFSSLFILHIFFILGRGNGVSLTRGQCWFIWRVAGEILHDIWLSLIGLLNVSQADLGLWLATARGFLFSQCYKVWRRLPWARCSRCQSFNYPWITTFIVVTILKILSSSSSEIYNTWWFSAKSLDGIGENYAQ
jgi:hypothetical protein